MSTFDNQLVAGVSPDRVITFTVWGEPKSKQRPRVTQRGTFTPKETIDAERRVRDRWRLLTVPRFEFHLLVEIDFYNGNKRKRDLDNMAKLVLDALNKEAYEDDTQVVELNLRKFYTKKESARTVVTLREIIEFPTEVIA
jgi:Holliday junction resolvase RusA-like endonuclease